MIGMLGHEIANPLAAIVGFSGTALEHWERLTPEKKLHSMAAVGRNADRLGAILQEFLAMVTVESGELTARPVPVRVTERLAGVVEAAGGDLTVDGPPDAVAVVRPGHLDQIVANLLSNAAKYGGGAVALTVRRDGGSVRIDVEERGPGVPESFRARLFDRFSRDPATAAEVRGTGLGLYIVRELARANGGDVVHRAHPAGGSVFTLILPEGATRGRDGLTG
ncbi:HAMP domain-containing sensor histidine kinase [Actinoplanes sp. NPDC051851]|uniref:sensor histidine kinase n=1 Tax=Actinoplanes sp. NPDC051851 TaxID=3154753 RepID=UPI003416F900